MPARLIVEAGAASPSTLELAPEGSVCLGRNRHNHIILRSEHASRVHAQIFLQNGRWCLRDCNTTNGTRINGKRIQDTVRLENGAAIGIGDIRLRFTVDVSDLSGSPPDQYQTIEEEDEASCEDTSTTLQADELSALVKFLNESTKETTPRGLLKLALHMVQRQTGADLCGFLSLDPDEPLPKVIVPDSGKVDAQLSRHLTSEALKKREAIWLARSEGNGDSDSLAHFSDAICVPLLGGPGSSRRTKPLGALHAYKYSRAFTQQQLRFCEALAGSLANPLLALRSRRALEADLSRLRYRIPNEGGELIGSSSAMKRLREEIDMMADSACTVLILGESGVGKELVALRLHQKSSRCDGPMVPVNCATLGSTAEADLFGHEKGAFTGALRDRPGHFQLADEGTLFLDEIGELSPDCQAKLLRVLETRSFRPMGADYPVTVDVRVVAATNRDLTKEIKEGRFRDDLFYRLGVCIDVPPLRERAGDVPELAEYFLKKLNDVNHKQVRLSQAAVERMAVYPWPGNVRQLRSVLETAIVRARRDALLEPSDLRLDVEVVPTDRPASFNLDAVEAWAIRQVLVQTEWNNTQAALVLGITRGTLIEKIRKYGLER